MRSLIVLSLLVLTTPALAMMETSSRQAASSSIPCKGKLVESYTAGGNVHNASYDLTLQCVVGSRVDWVLEAAASCAELNPDKEMGEACDRPEGTPLRRFRKAEDKERVHRYGLVRYVFGKDCARLDVKLRFMQAVTNKVFSDTVQPQLVCREVNVVNGTVDADRKRVSPGAFKYATITTTGEPEKLSDDEAPSIAGVAADLEAYRVEFRDGKRVEE